RYPLRGPRRPKGPEHASSNLLLYWFLYAAMRELDNEFSWPELERILCRVFRVEQAAEAVANVQRLRRGDAQLEDFPLPAEERRGKFYNSLNQVAVHAGMNDLILTTITEPSAYGPTELRRKHRIRAEWISLVDQALGGENTEGTTMFI